MNLKKFTKAELISKINGLKTKNNDNNSSFSTNLFGSLLLFKGFLLKITLIALIIKVFKKYSIFRKLWTFFSFILYSIFGISLIDIYEVKFLSDLFNNILDIFTKFNANILELFSKKVEVPIENPSRLKTFNQSSSGSKESNKIIERFSKIIHNEPIEVKESIVQEENTPLYKNKYVIIGGILVLSCLSWYFYDDIRPIASSLWTAINYFKPGPSNNPDGSNGNSSGNTKTNLQSFKDKLHETIHGKGNETPTELREARYDYFKNRYFSKKPTDEDIEMKVIFDADNESEKGKGKNIDLRNLSQAEIDRREGLQEQLTGLRDITGSSFKEGSDAVLAEINTFLNHHEADTLPKNATTSGMYSLLKTRLIKLKNNDDKQFDLLTRNHLINKKFMIS
jgi:hypothetical protein